MNAQASTTTQVGVSPVDDLESTRSFRPPLRAPTTPASGGKDAPAACAGRTYAIMAASRSLRRVCWLMGAQCTSKRTSPLRPLVVCTPHSRSSANCTGHSQNARVDGSELLSHRDRRAATQSSSVTSRRPASCATCNPTIVRVVPALRRRPHARRSAPSRIETGVVCIC
jgi:hypothetical protein